MSIRSYRPPLRRPGRLQLPRPGRSRRAARRRHLVRPGARRLGAGGRRGRAAEIIGGVGAVRFQRLLWPELAGLLAVSLLRTLLWLPVLYQLRKLLGALSVGRPFVRENADRLRRLGWTLIVVELALTILRLAEGLYVYLVWRSRQPALELWPLTVDLPTTGLFVGVALLVAAEAFRRGAQLEEEQAFTV
jgi:hypothetical protein